MMIAAVVDDGGDGGQWPARAEGDGQGTRAGG
jgi:hypothetical protein